MKRFVLLSCLLLTLQLVALEPHFMSDPAISPDGKMICFAYMSDLWIVPFEGGEAKRITVSEGNEWGPVYSPDGSQIAFNSGRDGYRCIYRIPANGGLATCVSREDTELITWIDDENMMTSHWNLQTGNELFIVSLDGSRPQLLMSFADYFSDISTDGKKVIFQRNGDAYREKYQGSLNGDLWEWHCKDNQFVRLTETPFTERYPVYSKISNDVYFVAPANETFQIFRAPNGQMDQRIQLTQFEQWSARDLSIARENDRIAFERFDELWCWDPQTQQARKIEIEIYQDFLGDFVQEHEYIDQASDMAIAPNGKWLAFRHKFDLFAQPEQGGEVRQITHNQPGIESIVIPDNENIFFTAFEQGTPRLFHVNIHQLDQVEKVKSAKNMYVEWIEPGPQKSVILHYSDGEERYRIAVMDSLQKVRSIITDAVVFSGFEMDPQQRYAAYVETHEAWNRTLCLYDFQTKQKHALLHYDGYMANIFWAHEEQCLILQQDQKIIRVDLNGQQDFLESKDPWDEILNPPTEKEDDSKEEADATPAQPILQDIQARIQVLVDKPGWSAPVAVVDDSLLYFVNQFEEEEVLYQINYRGENEERITSLGRGADSDMHYNAEQKAFYYIQNQRMKKLATASKKAETVQNRFDYTYNELTLNRSVFEWAWREFGHYFYDADMHGVDWEEAYRRYVPYLSYCYSPRILGMIMDEMIGDVNASHTGFYPRRNGGKWKYSAYLGVEFDYTQPLKEGIRIRKIYRKSKLNQPFQIEPGAILLAVDGQKIDSQTAINPLFLDKIGEKIELLIRSGKEEKTITVKGLSYRQHYEMYYDQWVAERRQKVEEWSQGEIGYLHIQEMDSESYDRFWHDLFAENYAKKAVIIDVRGNGGGNIHDDLMDALTRKTYAYSTSRFFAEKRQHAPYNVWQKPTVVLIDEDSFSDAEIFPALMKDTELATIIGMPTSGSVIGTTPKKFSDGSSMRMPRSGWYRLDGRNMEGNGVQPDIRVELTPQQIIENEDAQLQRAVEELLQKVK